LSIGEITNQQSKFNKESKIKDREVNNGDRLIGR